jgi:hypothetical protein
MSERDRPGAAASEQAVFDRREGAATVMGRV